MILSHQEPPIILSVGGSLVVPNGGIDFKFLSQLNHFIRKQVAEGKRFFLVIGGGKIARHYRDAGKSVIGSITDEDLDWIAIHATRLNAHLLRTIFQDIAHPRIIENYDKKLINWKEPLVVGAGWKPGWSTDYDAVVLAKDYGGHLIVNLSNIDWVYDKDPNKYKNAKPIEKITWEEMEKLVGNKWTPGLNAPFDPIATSLAKKHNLTVIVTNGKDFINLDNILRGEKFKGTVITPFTFDVGFYDREYYIGKKGGHIFPYAESLVGKIFHTLVAIYRAILIKITVNPKSCLDVGCGTGRLIGILRFFGIDAYGIDVSKHAIELASKAVKPFLKTGDITNLPFKDSQFDLVISYDVLERIERSNLKKALEETIRVSKKYVFHKIFTKENIWYKVFHRRDISMVSFFPEKYWQKLFSSVENAVLIQDEMRIRLPSFFETKFLLKKKS
ncbi:MAG: Aspartate/glutamate/uridylate kinase [Candidatus Roizmanbacteria bacterium GW2011_GWA2_36_23]|uniref:UMP kinase n=1 Tax=Candidatus Roizmanbacteria bacterium GW2011_GWA2_36_23 TaxID=1618480 RepID=A0A0G0EKK7_9BACT|nr:MAG: Aspartate/glutamate/uridylate kinase [Candidatus Roizmanbacteria bacterium GW2011_GWA2_36_23]